MTTRMQRIKKIAAMLAIARSSNHQGERDSFRMKARALMRQWRLSEADVAAGDTIIFTVADVADTKPWAAMTLYAVADLHNCRSFARGGRVVLEGARTDCRAAHACYTSIRTGVETVAANFFGRGWLHPHDEFARGVSMVLLVRAELARRSGAPTVPDCPPCSPPAPPAPTPDPPPPDHPDHPDPAPTPPAPDEPDTERDRPPHEVFPFPKPPALLLPPMALGLGYGKGLLFERFTEPLALLETKRG